MDRGKHEEVTDEGVKRSRDGYSLPKEWVHYDTEKDG